MYKKTIIRTNQQKIDWRPTPKQSLFLSCPADEILFGGAAAAGKSDALLIAACGPASNGIFNNSNWKGLLLRRTFQELESTLIIRSQALLKNKAKYDMVKHRWTFPSGGTLQFGHVMTERDVFNYQSAEYNFIGFDELTHFSEFMYKYLFSRRRTTDPTIKCQVMSASNPGGFGHCLPFGDVLTPDGWKKIENIKVGNMVATSDENENFKFVLVDKTFSFQYFGEIYEFMNSTSYFCATKEHSIARRTETKTKSGRIFHKIKLDRLCDLPKTARIIRYCKGYNGQEITEFRVPAIRTRKLKLKQPDILNGDDYCELMGWFLSEGCVVDRDKKFSICQKKEFNLQTIKELLNRCGFIYHKNKSSFDVHSPKWYNYLKQFGKCRDKFIPYIIKNSSIRQIKLFFSAMMLGDGYDSTYYTISERLADDMQELGLRLGYSPLIRSRQRKNRVGLSYDISFRIGRDGWFEKSLLKAKQYKGPVYCLGISNLHRFFVRQNGYIWLSGNSWVKERFITDKEKNKIYEYDIKLPDKRIIKTTRCFIPATVFDNPHIMDNDPGYVARLMQLPEIQKKALLYGDWEIFSGQFFSEFNEQHICNPFDIPNDWPIWLSMDWGYATKCWIGWWTEDPQTETVYLFNELYETKKSASEIAKMIKDKSGTKFLNIRGRYADRRISVRDEESGISTREKFAMEGIYWQMANSDRINGWQRCRELLKLDKEGNPKFQVFVTCENFIRTVPEQVHDLKNVEDMDKDGETHPSDGFRYFAISRKSNMNEPIEYGEQMNFNKITGYPDLTNNTDSVIKIKRLPNLVGDVRDYFVDRHR